MANSDALDRDAYYMLKAIELAQQAAEANEVPVGAIVVLDGEIVGAAANATITNCDPTGHAEVLALRAAAHKVSNYRLCGAELFVSIEPCAMCLGAIVQSRIARVVFGAHEPKAGVLESHQGLLNDHCLNHAFEIKGGVLAEDCAALMSGFFQQRRKLKARLKRQTNL